MLNSKVVTNFIVKRVFFHSFFLIQEQQQNVDGTANCAVIPDTSSSVTMTATTLDAQLRDILNDALVG